MSTTTGVYARSNAKLILALWIDQILLAVAYGMAGVMKLTQPIPKLAVMMGWPGVVPEVMVRLIGTTELAGALGLVLPMLTKIQPRLTAFASLGLAILQICAMVFHLSRAEYEVLPINLVLFVLALFIAWGRRRVLVPGA